MAMLAALFMTGMRLERLVTSWAGYRTGSHQQPAPARYPKFVWSGLDRALSQAQRESWALGRNSGLAFVGRAQRKAKSQQVTNQAFSWEPVARLGTAPE